MFLLCFIFLKKKIIYFWFSECKDKGPACRKMSYLCESDSTLRINCPVSCGVEGCAGEDR